MALKTMLAALVLTSGLAAWAALAQDPASASTTPGGKAVLARQAHYKELNAAFRGLNEQLKSETPDKAAIGVGAAKMKALAADLPSWFPKGSGPEAGAKTAAKAEVWTDAEGFAAAATKLQAETAKLAEVAASGDMDAVKAQVRATTGACKICHDKYRAA
jgi:cytochrome c556